MTEEDVKKPRKRRRQRKRSRRKKRKITVTAADDSKSNGNEVTTEESVAVVTKETSVDSVSTVISKKRKRRRRHRRKKPIGGATVESSAVVKTESGSTCLVKTTKIETVPCWDTTSFEYFVEDSTVSVKCPADLRPGDIIFFKQLILRNSQPVVEYQKAKLFFILTKPGTEGASSLLYRLFINFDEKTPSTWNCNTDPCSSEPFIVEFDRFDNLRKLKA